MKCPECDEEMISHRRLKGVLICPRCWFKWDPKRSVRVRSVHAGSTVKKGYVRREEAVQPDVEYRQE